MCKAHNAPQHEIRLNKDIHPTNSDQERMRNKGGRSGVNAKKGGNNVKK